MYPLGSMQPIIMWIIHLKITGVNLPSHSCLLLQCEWPLNQSSNHIADTSVMDTVNGPSTPAFQLLHLILVWLWGCVVYNKRTQTILNAILVGFSKKARICGYGNIG